MKYFLKNAMILTVTATIITFSSCKKGFLIQNPPTSLTLETALASESDLSTALIGAYSGTRNTDHLGRTVPVLGDLMSDNAYQSLLNSSRYTNFNNYLFTVTDGNIAGFWNSAYSTILRCNNIINSSVTANVNVNQIKGEALAIRALCYFNLVRYFARPFTDNPNGLGIPIITKFDINVFPSRNKISEVYTLINADLAQAFSLLTIFRNSTQFSKYAVRGLQAKVFLTIGDKTNAKTAALDVINNSGFTLLTSANHDVFWKSALPRTDKVETLFEVSSDAISNNGFESLPNIYTQSGYGDLLCSEDLYALFSTTDVRKNLYTAGIRGGIRAIFVNKYPNTFGTDISDTKVLRLSEMYLIAAEASLPLESDAIQFANIVIAARNATPLSSTGAALLEDIITERRKELAFEGDRYLDLQRLKRDVVRSINYPATIRLIRYSDFKRLLPIPQTELDVNPSIRLEQNPGW